MKIHDLGHVGGPAALVKIIEQVAESTKQMCIESIKELPGDLRAIGKRAGIEEPEGLDRVMAMFVELAIEKISAITTEAQCVAVPKGPEGVAIIEDLKAKMAEKARAAGAATTKEEVEDLGLPFVVPKGDVVH